MIGPRYAKIIRGAADVTAYTTTPCTPVIVAHWGYEKSMPEPSANREEHLRLAKFREEGGEFQSGRHFPTQALT
jgi:hypothetical protein